MINTIIFDFFGVMSTEVAPFLFAEVFEPEEAKRLKEEYMQPADRGDVSERELYESLGRLFSRTGEEVEADFLSRAVIDRSNSFGLNPFRSLQGWNRKPFSV